MKVRCVKFYNEHTKEAMDYSTWLTIGNEYIVLEIEIKPGENIRYRLVGDNTDESPGLYNAKQFEIILNEIPSTWKIAQIKYDLLILGPEAWQALGFWERCYDGEPDELEIYKREARLIVAEEIN